MGASASPGASALVARAGASGRRYAPARPGMTRQSISVMQATATGGVAVPQARALSFAKVVEAFLGCCSDPAGPAGSSALPARSPAAQARAHGAATMPSCTASTSRAHPAIEQASTQPNSLRCRWSRCPCRRSAQQAPRVVAALAQSDPTIDSESEDASPPSAAIHAGVLPRKRLRLDGRTSVRR